MYILSFQRTTYYLFDERMIYICFNYKENEMTHVIRLYLMCFIDFGRKTHFICVERTCQRNGNYTPRYIEKYCSLFTLWITEELYFIHVLIET